MTHAIMQAVIEAAKGEIMVVRVADNTVNNARPIHTTPRLGGPAFKQSTFDWKARDKFHELCSFETEVKKILVILSWLGHEGLRFVQMLNHEEQEKCKASKGTFKILSEKFKPQHNRMILSLQYYRLIRQ